MEATEEDSTFLEKIRPPRLEDAGLEDCALLSDSIKEAFLRAATAVGSFLSDGACVVGSPALPPDALVGAEVNGGVPDSYGGKKGGVVVGDDELGADLVQGGGSAAREDVVVALPVETSGATCVEGMSGLEVGEEESGGDGGEGPTLIEGYVV